MRLTGRGKLFVVPIRSVQAFNADRQLPMFFGGAGSHKGALNLPAQITIDYDNVDFFADRVAPGHEIEYLILVTSQFGNSPENSNLPWS